MARTICVLVFLPVLLVTSLLATFNFENYLFIHTQSYIQLGFSVCFLLVLLAYAVASRSKRQIEIRLNMHDLSVLALGCYYVLIYFVNPRYNASADNILFISIILISYFYVKDVLREKTNTVKIVLYNLLFFGLLQAIYGLLQLVSVLPNLFFYRFGGSFGNPGDLANLLTITYTVSLGLLLCERKKKIRIFLIITIALHLFLMVFSLARTAWLASISSTCFLLLGNYNIFNRIKTLWRVNNKRILIYTGIFVIIALSTIGASYKIYDFKSSSANGRVFIWKLCAELIYEKPVLGHGYDSFPTEIIQKQISYFKHNPSDITNGILAGKPVFAFNDFLQIWVEYGVVALIIMLFLMFRLFIFRPSNATNHQISLLLVNRAVIAGIFVCMLFSYPLQNPTIIFCFFLIIASISALDDKYIFSTNLSRKYGRIISLFLLTFLAGLFVHSSQSIMYGLRWKKAYASSESRTGNYVAEYDKLFKSLKKDRSFILNYGSVLLKSGNYKQCTTLYEKYGYMCTSSDMFMMMGDSYVSMKNYQKAEESYKNASFAVPHLFIPKFKLFKLYTTLKQYNKADSIALQISFMKIKIYSETVKNIKTEANEYLLSKKCKTDNPAIKNNSL